MVKSAFPPAGPVTEAVKVPFYKLMARPTFQIGREVVRYDNSLSLNNARTGI